MASGAYTHAYTHTHAYFGGMKVIIRNQARAWFKKDRNALRFLWVDDTKKSSLTVEEMRFTRVVFGVSTSPFLLNATINYHLERYRDKYSSLVDTLLQSMYVDDVTCGATSEDEAFQLYDTSIKLFAEGGFNLRLRYSH